MIKDEEIKMINEKLDYYMLKASDEEFDVEDVLKLVKDQTNLNQFRCRGNQTKKHWRTFGNTVVITAPAENKKREKEEQAIEEMEHQALKMIYVNIIVTFQ